MFELNFVFVGGDHMNLNKKSGLTKGERTSKIPELVTISRIQFPHPCQQTVLVEAKDISPNQQRYLLPILSLSERHCSSKRISLQTPSVKCIQSPLRWLLLVWSADFTTVWQDELEAELEEVEGAELEEQLLGPPAIATSLPPRLLLIFLLKLQLVLPL